MLPAIPLHLVSKLVRKAWQVRKYTTAGRCRLLKHYCQYSQTRGTNLLISSMVVQLAPEFDSQNPGAVSPI